MVVPNMIVTDEAFALRLKRYVAAGGCAVVTYRTAVKDRNNNLTFGKVLPVDCSELLGLHIEETESVQEYDCIPLISDNGSGTAGIFRDMIVPDGGSAVPLQRYLLPAVCCPSPATSWAKAGPTIWAPPRMPPSWNRCWAKP